MKLFAPDYYPEFTCIADRCRHSCCIGWEIDIDPASYARYQKIPGEVGEKLRSRIELGEDAPHFRLGEGDRCPFLNERGLCEMILELGEEQLCQICTDHPRFRNYFSHRTEVGLGLCCEAAGELILKRTAPMTLIELEDDGLPGELEGEEASLLELREQLLSVLQDREWPISDRLEHLLALCGTTLPERTPADWAADYLALERLDEGWTTLLEGLAEQKIFDAPTLHTPEWEIAWEQLAVYFLFRHLTAALEDGDVSTKAAFAALSVEMLQALCAMQLEEGGTLALDELVELARMYSGEIEYSEDNLQTLFDLLWE